MFKHSVSPSSHLFKGVYIYITLIIYTLYICYVHSLKSLRGRQKQPKRVLVIL